MKMVAGARLNRAQTRILELRPYAVKTQSVLAGVTAQAPRTVTADELPPAPGAEVVEAGWEDKPAHPLLVGRPEKRVLLLGPDQRPRLCGAFNTTSTSAPSASGTSAPPPGRSRSSSSSAARAATT